MTIDGKIDADDELKGKNVRVEVHLRSGSSINDYTNNDSLNLAAARTILYCGVYRGTDSLGTQEMLVLEKAEHYNRAHVFFPSGVQDKLTDWMESKKTYIALHDVLSIDAMD